MAFLEPTKKANTLEMMKKIKPQKRTTLDIMKSIVKDAEDKKS